MHKQVYFNNSATTPINKQVQKIIKRELKSFDNPSDITVQGLKNKNKIDQARQKISYVLNCKPNEIYFTASGSEGDNMCIKMLARKQRELTGKNHIITSTIEHKAVLKSMEDLSKDGFEITYVSPEPNGVVRVQQVLDAIRSNTCLISLMYVNNILGTIQPVRALGHIITEYNKDHKTNIIFHSDCVQALGNLKIDLYNSGIDAATFSGHKIGGPRIGFVYIKDDILFDSLISGGGQEFNKRAGTENLPYIMGLVKAVELSDVNIERRQIKIYLLNNYLSTLIKKEITNYSRSNKNILDVISNNLHYCFKDVNGDVLVYNLSSKYNISTSSGSACNSGNGDPDYVLKEIGVADEYINGSLRITINHNTTIKECNYFVHCLKKELKNIRGYI